MIRTDDPLNTRDICAGAGPDHAGAVFPDAGILLGGADHVSGRVLNVEDGDFHRAAADHPFDGFPGRINENDAVVVAGNDPHGNAFQEDLPADDIVAPSRVVILLVFAEIAIVGNAGEDFANVDPLGSLFW